MEEKNKPSLLDCFKDSVSVGRSLKDPTYAKFKQVKTPTDVWAHKINNLGGVVMVTDVEKQNTPLMAMAATELQTLEANSVNEFIDRDNDAGIRRLLQEHGPRHVWQPRLCDIQASYITSSFHRAAKKGALKCLQALIDSSPSQGILDIPDQDGNTPFMVAVQEAQPKAVEILLKSGAHVNVCNDKGERALHWLALNMLEGDKPEETLQEIVDILLSRPDIDLEPQSYNSTPLAIAAIKMPPGDGALRNSAQPLITFCKKLVKAGASLRANAKQGTIEEMLQNKKVLTAVLMGIVPPPSPIRPIASEFLDMIKLARDIDNIKEFLQTKSREEARTAVNCRLGSQTLLYYAVDKSNEPLVETFLKAGANAWALDITNELCIHRAAARGHFRIFDHIINHMKTDKNNPVDLQDYSFSLLEKLLENSTKDKKCSPEISHSKCFKRIMESDVLLNLNQELVEGSASKTPLHVAAAFNNQEALNELLSHGAFLGARRKGLGIDYGHILPALLPTTLERAMDGCIRHHPHSHTDTEVENVLVDDYTLDLDYSFLVPPVDADSKEEAKSVNEMETLMEISKSKRHRPAIKHPLVQTLLYAKWRKALPLYIFNLSIYFFFVVILTAFVYGMKDLRILEARADNLLTKGSNNATLEEDIASQKNTVNILMVFLVPSTIYIMVREIFQIAFSRSNYLKNIENYLEWFLILIVFILCVAPLDADVTRHLAAWAMIVAWYEFVLILGKAPPLAIYITMLRHVSWNFLKLIFLYGALILAFTVSFNIILQPSVGEDDTEFSEFWSTLPKAIVMATGEFEYSDLSQHFSRKILFLTSALLVFLLFLFLIFLVLMNVMNGLAVTDTQQVVDDAVLYSLTSRLELVYLIETLFLYCPGMRSYVSKVHLLTDSHNSPVLQARINKAKKIRLATGKHYDQYSKLDDDTTYNLRTHRLQHLEEEARVLRGSPVRQCLSILQELQDMATHHPLILQQAAASTLRGQ